MALFIADEFQFQELERSDEFRLLKLYPAKSESEPIIFELEHHSLNEPPKYAAVSYTWDGQAFDHEIYSVEGKRLRTTANCRDILLNMRHKECLFRLWIDQICINQKSDKDRSQNVRQMAQIYENADSVVVWTGKCIDPLRNLLSRMTIALSMASKDHNSDTKSISFTPLESDEDVWMSFLNRSWFHRMWTLQEFTLAQPSTRILLLIGPVLAVRFCALFAVASLQTSFNHRVYDAFRTNHELQKGNYPAVSLFSMLQKSKSRGCSDPKDKIFALYGIMNKIWLERGNHLPFNFPKPDYAQDAVDVFIQAIVWSLSNEETLDVLYLAPLSPSELKAASPNDLSDKFPTWVPDLPRLTKVERTAWGIDCDLETAYGYYHPCSASLDAPKFARFTLSPPILHLRGTIFDDIIAAGAELPPSVYSLTKEAFDFYNTELVNALEDWFMKLESTEHFDEAQFWDAVYRGNEPLREETSGPWMSWCYRYFSSRARVLLGIPNSSDKLDCSLDHQARNGPEHTPVTMFLGYTSIFAPQFPKPLYDMTRVFLSKEKHSFLITSKGNLGLAIGAIEAGDVVAVVAGLKRPIILRRRGERYALVGYAFVSGIMEGKAWPSSPKDLQDIELE